MQLEKKLQNMNKNGNEDTFDFIKLYIQHVNTIIVLYINKCLLKWITYFMKNLRETKEIFLNMTPIIQTKRNKMDMMAMQNKLNSCIE